VLNLGTPIHKAACGFMILEYDKIIALAMTVKLLASQLSRAKCLN